jgi:biopolymer transport protein ExbD
MRIPTSVRRGGDRLNLTPLIDVVFLLIVFFLLSSHFARQETQLELPLPAAASGQPPADDARPRLTINVLADGRVLLGGDAVDADELAARLAIERARRGEAVEIRIRAARDVPYQAVEGVLRAAAKAGMWNVGFAVVERDAPQAGLP